MIRENKKSKYCKSQEAYILRLQWNVWKILFKKICVCVVCCSCMASVMWYHIWACAVCASGDRGQEKEIYSAPVASLFPFGRFIHTQLLSYKRWQEKAAEKQIKKICDWLSVEKRKTGCSFWDKEDSSLGGKSEQKGGSQRLGHRWRTGGTNSYGGITETMLHSLRCVIIFCFIFSLLHWVSLSEMIHPDKSHKQQDVFMLCSHALRGSLGWNVMFLRVSDFPVCPCTILFSSL